MKDTVYTDVERQTASGKGGPSSKRGKLLYAVETDRKRIGPDIRLYPAGQVRALQHPAEGGVEAYKGFMEGFVREVNGR